METVQAIYNAGRWIVYCPKHGREASAVLADEKHNSEFAEQSKHVMNEEYICPVCYPGIIARMTVVRNGRIETIPDRSARRSARLMAEKDGKIYKVVFPDEREEIEQILSSRAHLRRNWDGPHETLDFLRRENHLLENNEKANQRKVTHGR